MGDGGVADQDRNVALEGDRDHRSFGQLRDARDRHRHVDQHRTQRQIDIADRRSIQPPRPDGTTGSRRDGARADQLDQRRLAQCEPDFPAGGRALGRRGERGGPDLFRPRDGHDFVRVFAGRAEREFAAVAGALEKGIDLAFELAREAGRRRRQGVAQLVDFARTAKDPFELSDQRAHIRRDQCAARILAERIEAVQSARAQLGQPVCGGNRRDRSHRHRQAAIVAQFGQQRLRLIADLANEACEFGLEIDRRRGAAQQLVAMTGSALRCRGIGEVFGDHWTMKDRK